jgi:histidine triad (HIT) family protein
MNASRETEQERTSPAGGPNPNCIFCKRLGDPALEDRLIHEDDLFHVSHQVSEEGPTYLGLALIQTKRHAPEIADLTEEEASRLGPLLHDVSRAVKSCTGAAWTYTYSFMEGERHVHVLGPARYPGTPREFVRLAVADWPGAPLGDRRTVADLSRRVREDMVRGRRGRKAASGGPA